MLLKVLISRRRYVSENMTTRHTEMMDTPEWMCFGIVLRTRTIDFSAESEEDAALWVVGLRTLLEQRRGDARGRAVGHFFWSRAAMKTRCASLALAPLPLILPFNSEKFLCGTGHSGKLRVLNGLGCTRPTRTSWHRRSEKRRTRGGTRAPPARAHCLARVPRPV